MVKLKRKVLGYWLVSLLLTVPVFAVKAQEMKEAADLYNAAATTYKQNPVEALKSVQQSIAICDQLDTDESKELRAKGQSIVPRIHVEIGKKFYSQQKIDECLDELRTARKVAQDNKDETAIAYATGTLASVLYVESTKSIKAGEYQKAIDMASESFSYKDKSVDPLIVIARAQDSLKKYDEMLDTYEKGIAIAKATNNLQRLTDMRILATNYLKKESQNLQNSKTVDDAIVLLNRAVKIDERDAEVYSALAVCFKAKNENDSIIYNADLAILNAPMTMDKTQLYFLKAQALQAKGDKDGACEAYKASAAGPFKESAEHQMKEVLKCK